MKGYIKDINGKFHLVEKDSNKQDKNIATKVIEAVEGSKDKKLSEGTQEAKEFIREVFESPKIKELDERLKKVEAFLFMTGTKVKKQ